MNAVERRILVERFALIFSKHFLDYLASYAEERDVRVVVEPGHVELHSSPSLNLVLKISLDMVDDPNVSMDEMDQVTDKLFPVFARQAATEYLTCITRQGGP